jgi:hypothetical protein
LPLNEKSIDDALELGISSCLQSLQISNPSLLLDANQLKKTERDVRLIPSVAAALTSMVLSCGDVEAKQNMMSMIKCWHTGTASHDHFPIVSQDVHDSDNHSAQNDNTVDFYNDKEYEMKLEASIASKFIEVMNIIKARKVEGTKKAEYLRRKKKVAKCSSHSDESSSVEDLDDFLSVHSSEHDADSYEESSNDDNATKAHTLNNDTEDFDDDDDWW